MSYQVIEKLRLGISWVYTKFSIKQARLIRYPSVIKGKAHINGAINLTTGYNCRIEVLKTNDNAPKLKIGTNVQLNDNVHIGCIDEVIIDDGALIASRVFITDHNHGSFPVEPEFDKPVIDRKLSSRAVKIGKNAWLGEGVIVLPGVEIGENSIIGAGAVVNKNIPKDSIAVGVPAKVVKVFNKNTSQWEATKGKRT